MIFHLTDATGLVSGTQPERNIFQPLDRMGSGKRASDGVYAALEAAIRELRLLPGELLSETDLARQFEVSRTPVREAIARLAHAGLIQVIPQVGTLVARIRIQEVEEARFVREHLEVAAVGIICESPDRDVSELWRLIEEQEAAIARGDLRHFFFADARMHMEIFRMCGNPGAWEAVQRKKIQLDRMRWLNLPQPNAISVLLEDHRHMVSGIEAGETALACERARVHARRASMALPDLQRKYPMYFLS